MIIQHSKVPKILSWFAPIEIKAINLFGLIFVAGAIDAETERHERIHSAQYRETLYVILPALYILNFVVLFLLTLDDKLSYREICFEREARAHQNDPEYLQNRPRFAWIRHILQP